MDSLFPDDMPEPQHLMVPKRRGKSDLLDGMNEAQVEAIMHRDGPCLVVAGAGSGKTTVMTKRVAALIESGVSPDEILLLTFTRAAATNMIERAKRYTPYADRVSAGTFHSIAHRVIKENESLFRFPASPSIMDPGDTETAFKSIAKKLGGKDENLPNAGTVAKAHSFATNTKRPLDDVVYDRFETFAHSLKFMEDCVKEYKTYKKERALLDYDDLLLVFDRMLSNEAVAVELRRRFRYVEVDEHQDSNALQCSIIEKLGGEEANVMVVGDPAQAIYGFRGAAPRTMFSFREIWPKARTVYLNTNYRSTEEVLAVGNAVDLSMDERFDRQLLPAPGAVGPTPILVSVPSPDQEASYVAEKVLEAKSDGIPLHEQAVLVRSLHAARMIEFEFDRRRIPYKVFGGLKVTEARHIKDFFSVVRCAVNTLDEPAWVRALCMARKVGPAMGEKVFALIAAAPLALGDPTAVVMKKTKENPDVVRIMQAWKVLATCKGKPEPALSAALAILDEVFLNAYPEDWKKSRKQDIEAVIGMSGQFDDLASYLSTLTLDHSVEKSSDSWTDPEAERPVTISTVHSAKGLEWDQVIVPSFVNGHMPSAFAREPDAFEEEKRVLYVAVTRPRKKLVMVKPMFNQQGNRNESSAFETIIGDYFERQNWGQRQPLRGFGLHRAAGAYVDLDDL